MYYNEQDIKVCKNCYKPEHCNCPNPEYVRMAQWVYDLMKKLNPMG